MLCLLFASLWTPSSPIQPVAAHGPACQGAVTRPCRQDQQRFPVPSMLLCREGFSTQGDMVKFSLAKGKSICQIPAERVHRREPEPRFFPVLLCLLLLPLLPFCILGGLFQSQGKMMRKKYCLGFLLKTHQPPMCVVFLFFLCEDDFSPMSLIRKKSG